MKRKVIFMILILVFAATVVFPVSASETLPLIVDNAGILDPAENASLEAKAQNFRSEYELDVVILTIDSLDGQSAQAYADNYYDSLGYGYGDDASGLLFLMSMEDREWYISTSGKAVYALTDYGIQELADSSFCFLDSTGYFGVFNAFFMYLPEYLDAYEAGTPIDGYADHSEDSYHGTPDAVVFYEEEYTPSIFLSLVIGILVAGTVILIMRGSMNTRRRLHGASGYMKSGSFRLRSHQDLFLYSNVSKVRHQQGNSTNSGGGSSVHRGSGGRRHGGGGGRF